MSKRNKKRHQQYYADDVSVEIEVDAQESIDEIPEVSVDEPLVEFDAWYASRSSRIPLHHHKEIIKADMKARKTPMVATMAAFDAALKKYGIKLD